MKKYSEELELKFEQYSQLSYKDTGKAHIELLLDNNAVGRVEVWTDRGNENREYIILNNEMIYLDSITKN